MLDNNDFVSIVLETDRPNPNLAEAEVRFVPSQIPGGKFEMPDVYLSLDGCSLAVDDLGRSFSNIENLKLFILFSLQFSSEKANTKSN